MGGSGWSRNSARVSSDKGAKRPATRAALAAESSPWLTSLAVRLRAEAKLAVGRHPQWLGCNQWHSEGAAGARERHSGFVRRWVPGGRWSNKRGRSSHSVQART